MFYALAQYQKCFDVSLVARRHSDGDVVRDLFRILVRDFRTLVADRLRIQHATGYATDPSLAGLYSITSSTLMSGKKGTLAISPTEDSYRKSVSHQSIN